MADRNDGIAAWDGTGPHLLVAQTERGLPQREPAPLDLAAIRAAWKRGAAAPVGSDERAVETAGIISRVPALCDALEAERAETARWKAQLVRLFDDVRAAWIARDGRFCRAWREATMGSERGSVDAPGWSDLVRARKVAAEAIRRWESGTGMDRLAEQVEFGDMTSWQAMVAIDVLPAVATIDALCALRVAEATADGRWPRKEGNDGE